MSNKLVPLKSINFQLKANHESFVPVSLHMFFNVSSTTSFFFFFKSLGNFQHYFRPISYGTKYLSSMVANQSQTSQKKQAPPNREYAMPNPNTQNSKSAIFFRFQISAKSIPFHTRPNNSSHPITHKKKK